MHQGIQLTARIPYAGRPRLNATIWLTESSVLPSVFIAGGPLRGEHHRICEIGEDVGNDPGDDADQDDSTKSVS